MAWLATGVWRPALPAPSAVPRHRISREKEAVYRRVAAACAPLVPRHHQPPATSSRKLEGEARKKDSDLTSESKETVESAEDADKSDIKEEQIESEEGSQETTGNEDEMDKEATHQQTNHTPVIGTATLNSPQKIETVEEMSKEGKLERVEEKLAPVQDMEENEEEVLDKEEKLKEMLEKEGEKQEEESKKEDKNQEEAEDEDVEKLNDVVEKIEVREMQNGVLGKYVEGLKREECEVGSLKKEEEWDQVTGSLEKEATESKPSPCGNGRQGEEGLVEELAAGSRLGAGGWGGAGSEEAEEAKKEVLGEEESEEGGIGEKPEEEWGGMGEEGAVEAPGRLESLLDGRFATVALEGGRRALLHRWRLWVAGSEVEEEGWEGVEGVEGVIWCQARRVEERAGCLYQVTMNPWPDAQPPR